MKESVEAEVLSAQRWGGVGVRPQRGLLPPGEARLPSKPGPWWMRKSWLIRERLGRK